jgi:hypothetical protein
MDRERAIIEIKIVGGKEQIRIAKITRITIAVVS